MDQIQASPTAQKLEETFGKFTPPLTLDDQMALLFAYRRALAYISILEDKLARKEEHNSKLDYMLQEWIISKSRIRNKPLLRTDGP